MPASNLKKTLSNKAKILSLSKTIRQKYRALRLGRDEEDDSLKRTFKPVTKPLEALLEEVKKTPSIKSEPMMKTEQVTTPAFKPRRIPVLTPKPKKVDVDVQTTPLEEVFSFEPPPEGDDDDDDPFNKTASARSEFQEIRRKSLPSVEEYLEAYPRLARMYIEGFLSDTENEYDTTYGLHVDSKTNKLHLGTKELKIGEDNEIMIDKHIFPGTMGLYELIFMTKPLEKEITQSDRENYKKILELTSAHKRNRDPTAQVKGTRAKKYTKYIRPATTTSKARSKSYTGTGYMINDRRPVQYMYYDDPNELVDRLRLLLASTEAGNDAHRNEIESIIEELQEAGYIK